MLSNRMVSVPLKDIKINDSFWGKHIDLVSKAVIPYQWEAMNDRIPDAESSHAIENFKIAAGDSFGEFYGAVFQDTDVAKWLEAVGFSLASKKDPELEKTADEVIEIIGRAQQPDGYINTYFTIKEPQRRWTNLSEGHELYTAGHLIEAAVAYYQGTGKKKFLEIMCRFADYIDEVFGYGKLEGYPGHPEVELALVKLYYATGEKKYLDLSKYFTDKRGEGKNYFTEEMTRPSYKRIFPEFSGFTPEYAQSHMPVRQQTTAEGHAVRAVYLYTAMADLAYEYQDEELMAACRRLWDNIVEKRMYITGGIGSSGHLERFTTDYDLPNDIGYCESCASIGLAMFGNRMVQITRDAAYADVVERALYNTMLAGIALDGKSFFYVNPLEVWPKNCIDATSRQHVKPIRQKWFGVACCPPNIARTLASMGQYIYSSSEEGLCVNLFIQNESEITFGDRKGIVRLNTEFPRVNSFEIVFEENAPAKLWLRIPSYASDYVIKADGVNMAYEVERGYAVIEAPQTGCTYQVSFKAEPVFCYANAQVRADSGRVCITRGPLVYTFEEVDNQDNLEAVYIDTKSKIKEVFDESLFGGIVKLQVRGKKIMPRYSEGSLYSTTKPELEDITLTAVPYPYWNNRGMGEMCVWMKALL